MVGKKLFSERGSLWMNIGIVVLALVLIFLIFRLIDPRGTKKTPEPKSVFERDVFLPYEMEIDDVSMPQEVSLPPRAAVAPMPQPPVPVKEPVAPVKAPTAPSVQAVKGKFVIQVASFQDRKKADLALEALKKKNYPAMIETTNLADKGTWYRVYVGAFETKDQAQTILNDVKKDYSAAFVKQL